MKYSFLVLILVFTSFFAIGQQRVWLPLDDLQIRVDVEKRGEPALSSRSLERRVRQGISLRATDYSRRDLQIESELKALGLEIKGYSRWLNAYSVVLNNPDHDLGILNTFLHEKGVTTSLLPVRSMKTMEEFKTLPSRDSDTKLLQSSKMNSWYNYGAAKVQTEMVHGETLHDLGYDGTGMLISIIDGSFNMANTVGPLFQVFKENRVLATYNFVHGDTNVFRAVGSHGMMVWSIIATDYEPFMVGSAPRASYVLLTSEDDENEAKIEEDNWILAMEFADSIGSDVINSSLGYTTFDDDPPYFPSDMDGRTAIVTWGAVMAHRVGMVVVTSAGNTGTSSWHIISAPADADSVLSIGAVDSTGVVAPFSGRGPTADGRIKPDVVAQGVLTAHLTTSGTVSRGNGTSFSSPLMAGFVTCLWQALPNASNYQIMDWVRQSASRYTRPDTAMGYGIPNFSLALEIAGVIEPSKALIYPNPTKGLLRMKLPSKHEATYQVYDLSGRLLLEGEIEFPQNSTLTFPLEWLNGVYVIRIVQGDETFIEKIQLFR